MNNLTIRISIILALVIIFLTGCATTRSDDSMIRESRATVDGFVDRDPGLQSWVDHAHAYAVFPEISKGGFWVGGGFGHGMVFRDGRAIGRTRVSQATVGAQIGAQSYSQIIFFQDESALRTFQRENLEFSAQATAVAASAGRAATTSYERGVAVFIKTRGGLMAEATVGGQRFRYEAL